MVHFQKISVNITKVFWIVFNLKQMKKRKKKRFLFFFLPKHTFNLHEYQTQFECIIHLTCFDFCKIPYELIFLPFFFGVLRGIVFVLFFIK